MLTIAAGYWHHQNTIDQLGDSDTEIAQWCDHWSALAAEGEPSPADAAAP